MSFESNTVGPAKLQRRKQDLSINTVVRRIKAVCSGCGFCTYGCPQVKAGLSPHLVCNQVKYGLSGPVKSILGVIHCTKCGRCDSVCPAGLSPKILMSHIKSELTVEIDTG